jgi:hypothetical protein
VRIIIVNIVARTIVKRKNYLFTPFELL